MCKHKFQTKYCFVASSAILIKLLDNAANRSLFLTNTTNSSVTENQNEVNEHTSMVTELFQTYRDVMRVSHLFLEVVVSSQSMQFETISGTAVNDQKWPSGQYRINASRANSWIVYETSSNKSRLFYSFL